MKTKESFLFSALSFFVANNLHFISDNGFIPRALDVMATAFLIWGFYLVFKKKK